MLTIKSARAPRWENAEHTCLTLMVAFEEHANMGEMPFTATSDDPTEHGRALYTRAVAGEFGVVRAYTAPVVTGAQLHAQWKAQRQAEVAAIVVTTASGRLYNGDELSQGRMARMIVSLSGQPADATVRWVLADNTVALVGAIELQEALTLAAERQTELWVKP